MYRDPKSGATWSGRGRAPAWLSGAKNRTRFLIDGASTDVAATKTSKPKVATKKAPVKKAPVKKAVASKKVAAQVDAAVAAPGVTVAEAAA
jgi:hypothetical protein